MFRTGDLHLFYFQDIRVKHADSWTNLGKMLPAPVSIKSSNESFKQFQKAALEKEENMWAKERKRQQRNIPQEKERFVMPCNETVKLSFTCPRTDASWVDLWLHVIDSYLRGNNN